MAVVSGPIHMVANLDTRFGDLSQAEADDEDVMCGVLQAVMARLPAHITARKYWDVIKADGFCVRDILGHLTRADLVDMGVARGHAIAIEGLIFPHVANPAVVAVVKPTTTVRTNPAPDFPAVGSTGLPTARALKAWMVGVYDTLKERNVDATMLRAVQARPKDPLDVNWLHGDEVDQELWTVLVRCGKAGMPADLILSFPESVRMGSHGLKAWKHLFERVLLVTDASIAALRKWFNNPPTFKQGGANARHPKQVD
jgi:hypothetical protein